MKRTTLVWLVLVGLSGCGEAPRGHEEPVPSSPARSGTEPSDPATKIPMH